MRAPEMYLELRPSHHSQKNISTSGIREESPLNSIWSLSLSAKVCIVTFNNHRMNEYASTSLKHISVTPTGSLLS